MKGTTNNYSIIAPIYDLVDFFHEITIYRYLRKEWFSKLGNELILDFGVGTGKNLFYLDESNEVLGIDNNWNMLQRAKKKKKNKTHIKLKLINSSMTNIKKGYFSVVIATFVLCTMNNPKKSISNIYKLLRPGGYLIIFEWVSPENKFKKNIYSKISPLTKLIFGVNFNRIPSKYYFSSKKWQIYKNKNVNDSIQVVVFKKRS